tara:strand:- start:942 stop:1490 length:549 start_codon:yes stop_codon:yes gene_type:complete
MSEIKVWAENTPNPQSKKFLFSQVISESVVEIANSEEAHISPLANKLFGFPWMQAVFIGSNFITITKQDWVDWEILTEPLCGLLSEHIQNGEPVVLSNQGHSDSPEDTEEIKTIKKILDREIRPQVALDGGDITFHAYENGRLELQLKGACSGCPSSMQTLKMGVESRLKQALPELKEVVAV